MTNLTKEQKRNYNKTYYDKHKSRFKIYNRMRYTENPQERIERSRADRLRRVYNLTPEQYNNLLELQNGHCAFCDRTEARPGHRLMVDHDHQTGKVRGLLCASHNTALGAFGDDVPGLMQAVNYLLRNGG
jgi:hypothetical protein